MIILSLALAAAAALLSAALLVASGRREADRVRSLPPLPALSYEEARRLSREVRLRSAVAAREPASADFRREWSERRGRWIYERARLGVEGNRKAEKWLGTEPGRYGTV